MPHIKPPDDDKWGSTSTFSTCRGCIFCIHLNPLLKPAEESTLQTLSAFFHTNVPSCVDCNSAFPVCVCVYIRWVFVCVNAVWPVSSRCSEGLVFQVELEVEAACVFTQLLLRRGQEFSHRPHSFSSTFILKRKRNDTTLFTCSFYRDKALPPE